MNFLTYRDTVLLRARPMDRDKQIKHALIGMVTEIGELGDAFKRNFVYGKPIDNVNVMEEIGDFLWYFVLLLDTCHVHMGLLDEAPLMQVADSDIDLTVLDPLEPVFTLAYVTGNLTQTEPSQLGKVLSNPDLLTGTLSLLNLVLSAFGRYSLSDCMERNDAKLELRTGKKFDAAAILNRDTTAERASLEG